ncbi:autotransporter domain-containing protein [Pseudomonas sp. WJP1]|uniref:autotransporter family protein n=1 Tax=Pseudomonas sp. WJP1 TaxID=2986947 RepID=UPI002349BF9A|nr:autotransporter outer membrane beta-barrel domain-containing protein [Pseudomonas sp. WJP1]WCM48954.1 autotransporter domain-containing protein [Pseudomonas sp. WJP1]
MSPHLFRKTLLALAIASSSVAVQAETLTVNDLGMAQSLTQHTDSVEIIGSNNSAVANLDVISLKGVTFDKDLILNATITPSGAFSDGVDFDSPDGPVWKNNYIGGDLINRGNISATGNASTALLIDPSTIKGSVINEGTLSSKGEPVKDLDEDELEENRAVDISGSTEIGGDLHNTTSGKIIAEGTDATGISMSGGKISGNLINDGSISVKGSQSTGIDLTSNGEGKYVEHADISQLINHGTITATGDDATAIELDGVRFSADPAKGHVINSGSILASDAAIEVGGFEIDSDLKRLRIVNNGTIIAGDEAIDASGATGGEVYLDMLNGSKITGNLIGLNGIKVYGNTQFAGTDATIDGANITLKNKGRIDVGDNTQAGHLDFTTPHTSIDGDMYVAETSSIGLNLSSATNASTPVLSVSGTAGFAKGSQIKLAAQGNDFSANGSEYTLVKAGTLENNGLTLNSTSALLNVDSYEVAGNKIVAKVTTKSDTQIGAISDQQGLSGNSRAALSRLLNDGVLAKISNRDDLVLQGFSNADDKQLAALAKQLTPEVNGGDSQAAATGLSLVNGAIGSRSSAARTGLSSGDLLAETGVWVQALTSDATQDTRKNVSGYDADSNGVAIGADGKLNADTTIGLAYSYLSTDVNSDGGNKTDVTGNALTVYGDWTRDNWFIDASLTYGWNDNDSKRSIAGTQAKANYDSDFLGLSALTGYSYRIDKNLIIEPQIGARYTNISIDSYKEKGSSAALSVGAQRYEVGEMGAGVRMAAAFDLGKGSLEPQAKVMAWHDFIGDETSSTSTFVLGGTPFTTTGSGSVRDSYELGLGLDYKLNAWTVGGSYDYLSKTAFSADTFTVKVRYDF